MNAEFPFPDAVLYHLRARHPRELFREISKELERVKAVDPKNLTELLVATEAAGGSVIGDGVAVVSCRAPISVTGARLCAIAKLANPVLFKGADTGACDLLFVIVSPENQTQNHLRDLSAIVRTLRDRDFLAQLRAETVPERIMSLFQARLMALKKAA